MEKNSYLLEVVSPFIDLIDGLIQGTGFIVVLTDKNGFVLEMKGDEQVIRQAGENNFCVGANRSERAVGTNAIGMAIIENKPFQIVGPEHYNVYHHIWTCSAAPIHDTRGRVIGILNLSGHYSLKHKHTLGMVISLVQAIEREFHLREKSENLKLINEHLKKVIDSISDGVIALDRNGTVTATNTKLKKLFQLNKVKLCGTNAAEIFGEKFPLLEALHSGQDYFDREDFVAVGSRKFSCISTARQIKNEQDQVVGVVGIFREKKEIHTMINRMIGARANFTFEDIVGKSPQLERAVNMARMVAQTDTRIILEGESGTGKELFAQAIHNASKRSGGPFIAINCGAIPRELIESELFGYSEGAFTGARKGGKPGKFELADGGTLFLDEVSSMPLDMQAKLLRVLQQDEITRVGGIETIPVNVRVIAASNKPLEELVTEGHFRSDLFYRLGVVVIKIPPLRERTGDIPLLFSYLLEKICTKYGIGINNYEEGLIDILSSYEWPGNVRELENYIERAVVLARNSVLTAEHFPKKIFQDLPEKQTAAVKPLALMEKENIERALKIFNGNISKTSRYLGITRNTLYNKLREYNIKSLCSKFEH
ncbi:MAG: sigma 54-interacting transcriptional regulator [Bacillota bacterium]